ncbi:N-acetylglutamate synthase [Chromobacterium violaceum]|uniref:N-acetylglutamate synthase n=1 Tax=Chromobacterium violaceum TaxID=536 RepID=A0A3S4HPQ6_CHRVL|nr:N-acetylglutamate synthase [Chromobacterium violaceum]
MEELATHAAIALKAEKLIFVVEGRGAVEQDSELISTLTAQQAEQLLQAGSLQDDVAACLPYCIRATREGIPAPTWSAAIRTARCCWSTSPAAATAP